MSGLPDRLRRAADLARAISSGLEAPAGCVRRRLDDPRLLEWMHHPVARPRRAPRRAPEDRRAHPAPWKDEAQSHGVQYDVSITGETPPVAGRPEELREVFASLVATALGAMRGGGRREIRLASAGETVEVAVSDTGYGMTDDVRQCLFEPFFAAKGDRGNGLGRPMVQAASGHEGLARCAAEPSDVVISNLSLPTMSGWEFAAACRERFPSLPVGLITGWGDRLDPALIERHRVRFVIAKPFEGEDVIRQLAQVLS